MCLSCKTLRTCRLITDLSAAINRHVHLKVPVFNCEEHLSKENCVHCLFTILKIALTASLFLSYTAFFLLLLLCLWKMFNDISSIYRLIVHSSVYLFDVRNAALALTVLSTFLSLYQRNHQSPHQITRSASNIPFTSSQFSSYLIRSQTKSIRTIVI